METEVQQEKWGREPSPLGKPKFPPKLRPCSDGSLGDSLFYRTPSSSSSAAGKSFLPSDAPSPGAAQLCHPRIILAQELLSADPAQPQQGCLVISVLPCAAAFVLF